MKADDIKVGHIYYVNYEPTRRGEFGKIHLCVVLKKNNDLITFVTIPLTSKEDAPYGNKLPLGIIESLPANLRDKQSYAVLDQIRTLNASRFRNLKQDEEVVDAYLTNDTLLSIYEKVVNDILKDAPDEIKSQLKIATTNNLDQSQ